MRKMEEKILSNWDAFTGASLKAEDVKSSKDEYVIVQLSHDEQDGRHKLILTLERNGIQKMFYLNSTNTKVLKDVADSPKELIGKKVNFVKIKVNNPQTGKIQDSLVIDKVV